MLETHALSKVAVNLQMVLERHREPHLHVHSALP